MGAPLRARARHLRSTGRHRERAGTWRNRSTMSDTEAARETDGAKGRRLCPIFCRGHSGGRIVCEAFIRNGVDMGRVAPDRKDT